MKTKKQKEFDWVKDLANLIQDFTDKHDVDNLEMLSFLATTMCGTMAMMRFTEEFAKETFDKLFRYYLEKKKEFETSPEDYIFSSELRKRMGKFGNMPIEEALKSKEFWTELALHGGMTPEELEKIMNGESSLQKKKRNIAR